jgi:hypothetical protein
MHINSLQQIPFLWSFGDLAMSFERLFVCISLVFCALLTFESS